MSARNRRWLSATAALGAHALVLAALGLSLGPRVTPAEVEAIGVSLHDGFAFTEARSPTAELAELAGSVAEEALDPPPPDDLSPASELTLTPPDLQRDPDPVGEAMEGSAVAAAALGAAGATCSLGQALGEALQADAGVQASLARVPSHARSVADAVMLWDGRWVAVAGVEPDVLSPVRQAIADQVRGAPPACREEANRGPTFIPVRTNGRTMLLTVGSGEWRWTEVLASSQNNVR